MGTDRLMQIVTGVVATIGVLVALVASFFFASEDVFPGSFYVGLQALWMGGSYYPKLTYLLTLFTLLDLVIVPLIALSGVITLGRAILGAGTSAPPGWDTSAWGRRAAFALGWLALSLFWLAFTVLTAVAPGLLAPVGYLAVLFLLVVPIAPITATVMLFEALAPPRFHEGVVSNLQHVANRGVTTTHFNLGGSTFTTEPSRVTGIYEGAHVALLASGFLGTLLRVERRG